MIRMNFGITLQYEVIGQPADFILNIHAANTPHQTVVTEEFSISQSLPVDMYEEPFYGTRFARFKANSGPITVRYNATVDIDAYIAEPSTLRESPIAEIPQAILHYVYPSRYCQSDRLHKFAAREFGQWAPGFSRVQAIAEWIRKRTVFESGASKGTTSAVDTLIEQVGVCRDFAHLMIALCRAVNIPARFATGIDYGADPILGPTDFHAYVEVYVGDRWYLFDSSGVAIPMGFLRFGTGRDAADTAFATIFGGVVGTAPVIQIEVLPNEQGELVMPQHVPYALSTDGQLD